MSQRGHWDLAKCTPPGLESGQRAQRPGYGKATAQKREGRQKALGRFSSHYGKEGKPKILRKCTLPLTGLEVVDTIVTELCLIDVTGRGLVLRELREGVTAEEVQRVTEPQLIVEGEIRKMEY